MGHRRNNSRYLLFLSLLAGLLVGACGSSELTMEDLGPNPRAPMVAPPEFSRWLVSSPVTTNPPLPDAFTHAGQVEVGGRSFTVVEATIDSSPQSRAEFVMRWAGNRLEIASARASQIAGV